MGHDVYRDVLDNAPRDLGAAERVILLALADMADETTRQCSPTIDVLEHQTGQSADSLRKTFQRLGRRGLDPRVRIGTDRRGQAVYAYEGTATTYRVPRFDERQMPYRRGPGGGIVRIQRRESVPTSESGRGGNTGPQRREHRASEAGTQGLRGGTPFPPYPLSQDPLLPAAAGAQRHQLLVELGATPDEERRIVEEIEKRVSGPIRRWDSLLRTMHAREELAPILDAIRAPARDRARTDWRRTLSRLPRCAHEVSGGRERHPETGRMACNDCERGSTVVPLRPTAVAG